MNTFAQRLRSPRGSSSNQSGGSSSGWGGWGGQSSDCGRFSDVSADHPGFGSIEAASEQGWISGCGGDRFCPEESLTRAQAAQILSTALGLRSASTNRFTDIQGHWAKDAIGAIVAAEIMAGCTADSFCPDETLTRAQAAVVTAKASYLSSDRASNFRDVPYDHWARPSIAALEEKSYIGGCSRDEFCLDAPTRRWIFITWLGNVLSLDRHSCQ